MLKLPALALTLTLFALSAQAQSDRDCHSYARDYAAMVAPRSGSPTVRNTTSGYPNQPGMGAPRTQTGQSPEWSTMVPHQNAYQRAFDECMARRGH